MPRAKKTTRTSTVARVLPPTPPVLRQTRPPFTIIATFRASSAQLVTLFQNLPHLLEDIKIAREGELEDMVTFPRGTVIGDALAESSPAPVRRVHRAAPKAKAAPAKAKGNGAAEPDTFQGKTLTPRMRAVRDGFVKRFGPEVNLRIDPGSGNVAIDAEANLKRIGRTREEVMDQSWSIGSIEYSLKKSFTLAGKPKS